MYTGWTVVTYFEVIMKLATVHVELYIHFCMTWFNMYYYVY